MNKQLQQLIDQIEAHNIALRTKGDAIPESVRGGLTVDKFCALPNIPDVDEAIQAVERQLSAANDQDAVRNAENFASITLPSFNTQEIIEILKKDLDTLDAQAVSLVQSHITKLGDGGETWVLDGMQRLSEKPGETSKCPFCGLDLKNSDVFQHYKAYFSRSYSDLKRSVTEVIEQIKQTHADDIIAKFENKIKLCF